MTKTTRVEAAARDDEVELAAFESWRRGIHASGYVTPWTAWLERSRRDAPRAALELPEDAPRPADAGDEVEALAKALYGQVPDVYRGSDNSPAMSWEECVAEVPGRMEHFRTKARYVLAHYTPRTAAGEWNEAVEACAKVAGATALMFSSSASAKVAANIRALKRGPTPASPASAPATAPAASEEPEKCEGCDSPATTQDSEGIPLCEPCMVELVKSQGFTRKPVTASEAGPVGWGVVAPDGQLLRDGERPFIAWLRIAAEAKAEEANLIAKWRDSKNAPLLATGLYTHPAPPALAEAERCPSCNGDARSPHIIGRGVGCVPVYCSDLWHYAKVKAETDVAEAERTALKRGEK